MRARSHFAVFAALALLAAGCGDAAKGKLNNGQANDLLRQVELAQAAVDQGKCGAARDAALEGAQTASKFGKRVDSELQNNLVEGFNHLHDTVTSECQRPERTPTPTPTETPTEIPTETPTEVPTEIPTETPTEVPTETPTQAPTEEPTEEPTSETGGIPPGDEFDE